MEPVSHQIPWALPSHQDTSIPDLLAPVVAFRDWRVTEEGLCSARLGTPWPEPILEATCLPQRVEHLVLPAHAAPDVGCDCGIHAYHSPVEEISKIDFRGVCGVVTLWGRMCVCQDEIRAQYARVECLAIYSRWTQRQKDAVQAVASDLGCDLVDLRDLRHAAARYADPLPDTLRPRPVATRSNGAERGRRAGRMLLVGT